MNPFYTRLVTLYKQSKGIYDDDGYALVFGWSDVLRDLEKVAAEGKTEAWFSENMQTAREMADACGLTWDNVTKDVQFVKVTIPTK